MGSGYSTAAGSDGGRRGFDDVVSRLAQGKQAQFRSFVGTTLKVHPPGARLLPGQGVAFELGIDLVDPSVGDDHEVIDPSFPPREKRKKTLRSEFDRIANELETHFGGRAFEQDLTERMLTWLSSDEEEAEGGKNSMVVEYGVPPLPEQTGLRLCGRVGATRRRIPNPGRRHLGIASYDLCIPLVLVSFFSADDDNNDNNDVVDRMSPPSVPIVDVGLNVAAQVTHAAFGGGLVQNTPVEYDIYDAGFEVNVPYMNFIGLGAMEVDDGRRGGREGKGRRTTKKEGRPSPTQSATQFHAGKRMRGNDGSMYVVVQTSNGTKRWTRTSS